MSGIEFLIVIIIGMLIGRFIAKSEDIEKSSLGENYWRNKYFELLHDRNRHKIYSKNTDDDKIVEID